MKKVLIIDDEEKLRNLLAKIVSYEGFNVHQAADGKTALSALDVDDFDVVICDVKLPDINGLELLKNIKEKHPLVEIILLTAYGNIEDGVNAIKNGAFDYITKGDDNNKIIPLVQNASEKAALTKRVQHLEKQLQKKYTFDSITANSKSIQQAIDLAKRVAQTETTVLLTGETGTGKEVFAQAIHQAGNRKKQNFVAVNCSAFNNELLESEMFGHKAGAFTGAVKDQKGLFEEANSGTIFLDEIGEMSFSLQTKLLRVLETGEFIKVGETRPRKTNVRIIAATNRDLLKEVEAGQFRQDLFYRLAVFQIKLPPLRERVADIGALVSRFAEDFAVKSRIIINSFSSDFLTILQQYSWPGNIRELRNVIERSVILSKAGELDSDSLPPELTEAAKGEEYQCSEFELANVEKRQIQKVLNYTNGNKTKAAQLLGIALTTLYRKLNEYNLK